MFEHQLADEVAAVVRFAFDAVAGKETALDLEELPDRVVRSLDGEHGAQVALFGEEGLEDEGAFGRFAFGGGVGDLVAEGAVEDAGRHGERLQPGLLDPGVGILDADTLFGDVELEDTGGDALLVGHLYPAAPDADAVVGQLRIVVARADTKRRIRLSPLVLGLDVAGYLEVAVFFLFFVFAALGRAVVVRNDDGVQIQCAAQGNEQGNDASCHSFCFDAAKL